MTTIAAKLFAAAWLLQAPAPAPAPKPAAAPAGPGYVMFRCIDTLPGKGDEYRDFMLQTTAKSMQVRADEGNIDGWVFARAVIPSGTDASCAFIQANVHKGFPPERTPIDPYFVKAGVKV